MIYAHKPPWNNPNGHEDLSITRSLGCSGQKIKKETGNKETNKEKKPIQERQHNNQHPLL